MSESESQSRLLGGASRSRRRGWPFGDRVGAPLRATLNAGGLLGAALILAVPIIAILVLVVVVPVAIVVFLGLFVLGMIASATRRVREVFGGAKRAATSEGGRENVRVVR
ncbi:MAG: hypothetical protein U0572_00715 [Phycisphaerales bacterium]